MSLIFVNILYTAQGRNLLCIFRTKSRNSVLFAHIATAHARLNKWFQWDSMHQIFFSVSTKRKKIILKNNFSLDSLIFKTQFLPSFSQRDLSQVDVLRQIKEKYLISEIKLFVVRTGILVYFYTDDIIYIF